MLGQELELLVRVKAALALVDGLHGAVAPRAQQRRDPGRPSPLTHAVEQLPVLHVMAIDELLVGKDVAMGVKDPLRQPRGARRVVQLRRIVGRRIDHVERSRTTAQQVVVEDQQVLDQRALHPIGIRLVRNQYLGARVRQPVTDPLVAVEH